MALAAWAIRPDEFSGRRARIDLPGLVLSAGGLFTLTYALIEGHDKGWTSNAILGSFAVGALALLAFVAVELRPDEPMVDVSLFTERVFTGGIVAVMMW